MHVAVHINICYESIAMLSYLWWILYFENRNWWSTLYKVFFLIAVHPLRLEFTPNILKDISSGDQTLETEKIC